jgi:hypothetical protein
MQSLYRPGQGLSVPGVEAPRFPGKELSDRLYQFTRLYSFLLEAESTAGPYCSRKDYVNENLQ